MANKTVLITGAARRLGAAIACELHDLGMDIVIHYHRSRAEAMELANQLNDLRPGSATLLQADLLQQESYAALITRACDVNRRLDCLVNNASAFYAAPLESVTFEQWDELMTTNLKAPFFLSRHAAPHLRTTRGCIINLSDIHGLRPLKNFPVYSAAKAALNMLTAALAVELGPEIRVNGIAPGAVLWPDGLDNTARERIIAGTILRRQGETADITRAIRYLLVEGSYITGQTLTIDGGRTLV